MDKGKRELERFTLNNAKDDYYRKEIEHKLNKRAISPFEKVLHDQVSPTISLQQPSTNKEEKKDIIKDINDLCLKMKDEYRPTEEVIEELAEKMAPITEYSKEEAKRAIIDIMNQFDKVSSPKKKVS